CNEGRRKMVALGGRNFFGTSVIRHPSSVTRHPSSTKSPLNKLPPSAPEMVIIGLIAVSGSGTPSPIPGYFFQHEASTQGKELFGDIRHQLPSSASDISFRHQLPAPSFRLPASVFRHPSSVLHQIPIPELTN